MCRRRVFKVFHRTEMDLKLNRLKQKSSLIENKWIKQRLKYELKSNREKNVRKQLDWKTKKPKKNTEKVALRQKDELKVT